MEIKYRGLIWVIGVSLLMHLLFFLPVIFHPDRAFQTDSWGYQRLATSLRDSLSFPSLKRTPVYPAFLAAVYGVAGEKTLAVIGLQIFMNIVLTIMIFFVVQRDFGRRAALVSGVVYSLNPLPAFYSCQLMTEIPFALLTFLGFLLFWRTVRSGRPGPAIMAALFLGLASLCRPIGLFFPLLLSAALLFIKRDPWGTRLRLALLFLLVSVLVLLPWSWKNARHYGTWKISNVSEINLLNYNAAAVLAERARISRQEASQQLREQVLRESGHRAGDVALRDLAIEDAQASSIFLDPTMRESAVRLAFRTMLDKPFLFLKTHLLGILKTIGTPPVGIFQLQRHFFGTAESALQKMDQAQGDRMVFRGDVLGIVRTAHQRLALLPLPLLFLWCFGLVLLVLQWIFSLTALRFLRVGGYRARLVVLSLMAIAYFLLLPGAAGNNRFRVPAEPYVAMLAGMGLTALFKKKSFSKYWDIP